MAGALRRVRRAVVERKPCFMSTPNTTFLIGALTDEEFRDSVLNSDLSIPDGSPLVWVAFLLGIPIRERVAGSNLFEALRQNCESSLSVFFFGGPEGVAQAACRQVTLERGGVTCAGFESPGFGSIEELSQDQIIERINASNADFLLIALGAKKGQAWIERNRERITIPVYSHLGAVVNFVAGTVRRAPEWMQKAGLEWIWRIKEEPVLWRRYFNDGLLLVKICLTHVLRHAWFLRMHRPQTADILTASILVNDSPSVHEIKLSGAWILRNIAPLRTALSVAVLSGKNIQLDLSAVTYVDSAFVGLVTLLYGHQKRIGKNLLLSAPQPMVRRTITYSCADYLFA